MEDYIVDIEAYLDERMTMDERLAFEERLNSNSKLRKELDEYRHLRTDLAYHYAAQDVANANRWRGQSAQKSKTIKWLLLALLAALLAGILYWANGVFQQTLPPAPTSPVQPTETNQPLPAETTPAQDVNSPVKNKPMAQQVKPNRTPSGDLYRDLPAEPVSDKYRAFFEQQIKKYTILVENKAPWAPVVTALEKGQPNKALQQLGQLPPDLMQSDTAQYLEVVANLLLQRPVAVENLIYPLLTNPTWKDESRYLLIWSNLLQGNQDMARAVMRTVDDDYRDKQEILQYLDKR